MTEDGYVAPPTWNYVSYGLLLQMSATLPEHLAALLQPGAYPHCNVLKWQREHWAPITADEQWTVISVATADVDVADLTQQVGSLS